MSGFDRAVRWDRISPEIQAMIDRICRARQLTREQAVDFVVDRILSKAAAGEFV